jgi:hypothetical protein
MNILADVALDFKKFMGIFGFFSGVALDFKKYMGIFYGFTF